MTSFIKQYQQENSQHRSSQASEANTDELKLKMKALEQEILSLQQMKSKNQPSHKNSKSEKASHLKTHSQKQQDPIIATPIQPLNLANIKSNKVTELVTQIHTKSSARSRRKLSIQRYVLETERQTVNSIKDTLEKIDVSSGRKKKKVSGVNVYELKGLKHNVDSNIFNVTIAEIMTEEHEKYELVKEIKRLKDKLKDLQEKKIENEQARRIKEEQQEQEMYENQEYEEGQGQFTEDNDPRSFIQAQERKRIISNIEFPVQGSTGRKTDTIGAGRIYSRSRVLMNFGSKNNQNQDQSELNNSRTTEQLVSTHRYSIQLRRNSNPLTWNPEVTLDLNKKNAGEIRTHRTINHRVSNSIHVNKKLLGEESSYPTSRTSKPFFRLGSAKKQILKQFSNSPSLQLPQSNAQNNEPIPQITIKLVPELKIKNIKQNQSIPEDFVPNFRQYIKSKLLTFNLPPQPSQHETQSELQSFGRILFALFDIYVEDELKKGTCDYKVTKFKNCVLYRLNDEKNIVWYYDGKFYFGGWEINLIGEGKKQGFGIEILPNQHTYQGFYANNKRHGYGIMFSHAKAEQNKNIVYEGTWKEGLKNGKGYQAEPDLEYLGDFEAGLQTGQCKIKTAATFYEGTIRESVKQGKGLEILKNGDQYHGLFKQNMFHGIGQYRWKSGAYFYGSFHKGIRKGQGIWISNLNIENPDIYKGSYEENRKNGFGMYQWANGAIYEGYFKNDLRHDEGLMKYPNGKAAKFMWRDGNKANKLYSKEEEEYRCNRNSAIKISPGESENDEEGDENGEQMKGENTFKAAIINELSANAELLLFNKSK